ncbi:hypothetical protein NECID01_2069 [Nematocida sp. AWRm77]|nr:hypothetical protein NECID01_2069 [Nematocida sp. AWRm77]
MKYSWYETSSSAVLVVYTKAPGAVVEVRKTETGVEVCTEKETVPISISHAFEVGEKKKYDTKVEILLEKPIKKRWRDLCPVEKTFERGREIEDVPSEEYSRDPVLNMLREVYANTTDTSRREMNQSFVESRGKELRSTPAVPDSQKKKNNSL